MQTEDFAKWLMDNKISSFRTYLGKLERVEQYEGNLDEHFSIDACASLLKKLTYSKTHQVNGELPAHTIPIEPIKNDVFKSYYDGTRDYKCRVNKYIEFKIIFDNA